jgi:hypothetical protein
VTFTPTIAAILAVLILVGGPIYLVVKAVERRKVRKAEEWRLSTPGFQHHAEIASARIDSLGPLSLEEHQALLFNLLWVSSHQGAVGWEGIVAQTGAARQMVRDHLNSLATDADEAADSDAEKAPASEAADVNEDAAAPEPDTQPKPRH